MRNWLSPSKNCSDGKWKFRDLSMSCVSSGYGGNRIEVVPSMRMISALSSVAPQ